HKSTCKEAVCSHATRGTFRRSVATSVIGAAVTVVIAIHIGRKQPSRAHHGHPCACGGRRGTAGRRGGGPGGQFFFENVPRATSTMKTTTRIRIGNPMITPSTVADPPANAVLVGAG